MYVLCGGGRAILFESNPFDERQHPNIIATAPLGADNSYKFNLSDIAGAEHKALTAQEDKAMLGSAAPPMDLDLIHQRMGHRNKRDLAAALGQGKMTGLPPMKNKKTGVCSDCAKAKSTRASIGHAHEDSKSRKNIERLTLAPRESIVQRINTDLKGPMSVAGYHGELYMQLFTASNTKWRTAFCFKSKDIAAANWETLVDVQLASEGQRVLEYHSDGAPELISKRIVIFSAARKCKVSYSPAYTPELNGLAEISNKIIWESAFSMLLACALPYTFWPFAVSYATLISNFVCTTTAFGWMTPWEAKYGSAPDISAFRKFGCIVYAHIDKSLRDKTFTDKAYKGYFLGLQFPLMNRAIVYIPEQADIVESLHVIYDEVTVLKRTAF